MFDISSVRTRYFAVKVGDTSVDLKPCKVKVMRSFKERSSDLRGLAADILNNNKQGYIFDSETIDNLDWDQLSELIKAYFTWLKSMSNDPN